MRYINDCGVMLSQHHLNFVGLSVCLCVALYEHQCTKFYRLIHRFLGLLGLHPLLFVQYLINVSSHQVFLAALEAPSCPTFFIRANTQTWVLQNS